MPVNFDGEFNVHNLLAVAATLKAMGYPVTEIGGALQAITAVRGRMDVIDVADAPGFVIDYAHTPDALEKALAAVQSHFPGQTITCVFGCGGNRDKDKRPVMGAIAVSMADRVVITDDNPRFEASDEIIADILKGISNDKAVKKIMVVPDRALAIGQAFKGAGKRDVILVAGKGHEDYQDIEGKRIAFSDYAVIETLLAASRVTV